MNTIISLPESAWRVTRREFFQRLGGTSAAAATFAGSFAPLKGSPGMGHSPV